MNKEMIQDTLLQIDNMNGDQFEIFMTKLLSDAGYLNMTHTPLVNDHGLDAYGYDRYGNKVGFQYKNYTHKVPYKAVYETLGGAMYYETNLNYLVTNNYFTDNTVRVCKQMNQNDSAHIIKLCDRNGLVKLIIRASKNNSNSINKLISNPAMAQGNNGYPPITYNESQEQIDKDAIKFVTRVLYNIGYETKDNTSTTMQFKLNAGVLGIHRHQAVMKFLNYPTQIYAPDNVIKNLINSFKGTHIQLIIATRNYLTSKMIDYCNKINANQLFNYILIADGLGVNDLKKFSYTSPYYKAKLKELANSPEKIKLSLEAMSFTHTALKALEHKGYRNIEQIPSNQYNGYSHTFQGNDDSYLDHYHNENCLIDFALFTPPARYMAFVGKRALSFLQTVPKCNKVIIITTTGYEPKFIKLCKQINQSPNNNSVVLLTIHDVNNLIKQDRELKNMSITAKPADNARSKALKDFRAKLSLTVYLQDNLKHKLSLSNYNNSPVFDLFYKLTHISSRMRIFDLSKMSTTDITGINKLIDKLFHLQGVVFDEIEGILSGTGKVTDENAVYRMGKTLTATNSLLKKCPIMPKPAPKQPSPTKPKRNKQADKQVKFCPNCGTKCSINANFCTNCGHKF